MKLDAAVKLIKVCIAEVQKRFVLQQPKFMIKVVDKEGARVLETNATSDFGDFASPKLPDVDVEDLRKLIENYSISKDKRSEEAVDLEKMTKVLVSINEQISIVREALHKAKLGKEYVGLSAVQLKATLEGLQREAENLKGFLAGKVEL
eukprot:TRINITY_DN8258_c0_g2_i1.p1 TRINITY_DN8258_c0_g2~~TRINITY_DN8258_c0_g2_i1.p1  ORF type:complete len:172 (+),score=40.24 TRINITY_DN8258_c0_g2_i1:70-516(+)